ncbi:MAG: hypothetical protein ACRDF4_09665 [Rhabdochlamydiaceae bacterium]
MNFTREPIIETIISPREGYRLIVRSTKHASDEEFTVDAVEVVSFGSALFYRSLEKPHPFLLPVADYQVVEGKESRVVLKNAPFERTIKIGGGREASFKKEPEETDERMLHLKIEDDSSDESTSSESGMERKRERRRNRRRRGGHEQRDEQHRPLSEPMSSEPKSEVSHATSKEPFVAPLFTHLIPPPTSLISDSIQKYKDQQAKEPPALAPEPAEIPQKEGEGEANSISRTLIEPPPFTPGVSTMNDWSRFFT